MTDKAGLTHESHLFDYVQLVAIPLEHGDCAEREKLLLATRETLYVIEDGLTHQKEPQKPLWALY